jgi:hypothetical protein
MVFNLGYTYFRWYAKIFTGYVKSKKKRRNNLIFFRDKHWIISHRFRVSHRRPGCKDICFRSTVSPSLSFMGGTKLKRNYIWGYANKNLNNIVLDNRLTDGGKVVSLTRRSPFIPPGEFLVLISVGGWVHPRAIMQLEGLGQLKNPMTSSRMEPAIFPLLA